MPSRAIVIDSRAEPPAIGSLHDLGRYGATRSGGASHGARITSFAIAAVLLIGTPWFLLARGIGEPSGPIAPGGSGAASVRGSAPGKYRVVSESACLRIRTRPSTEAGMIGCLQNGTLVQATGESRRTNGRKWAEVVDPISRRTGWAARDYLRPAR